MLNLIFRFKEKSFVIKESNNEMVLVPLTNQIVDMTNVMLLTETAAVVLKSLNGNKSLKDICGEMVNDYNIDIDVLEKDVVQFIEKAIEKNIVEEVFFNNIS